jgi:hypothetical protein
LEYAQHIITQQESKTYLTIAALTAESKEKTTNT